MKIGILTFHRPCNFGANLQAFCSYNALKLLGHNVKVIDYVREADDTYTSSIPRQQFEEHKKFLTEKLSLTKTVRTTKELQNVVFEEYFDLIVIGADAVWRCPKDDDVYFAKWLFEDSRLSHIPVVSLSAAHMGNGFKTLSAQERLTIKDCIVKFKYVTVRDNWTRCAINRDIFNGDDFVKIITPDPVMMLDALCDQEWDSQGLEAKKYYLMSLSKDWAKGRSGCWKRLWFHSFKRIVNRAGYCLVELPLPEGTSGMPFDYSIPYPIHPLQWFLWLKNAKAYCGQRFHSIVSCISAGTPFFSIDVYGNNSIKKIPLDLLGFYGTARKGDENSKINYLLKGSGFEENRVDVFIEAIKPSYLFHHLEEMKYDEIIKYRDVKISEFKTNINKICNVIIKK